MKRVNIALIILAALFTASCTDFDNNLSEAEIRYNQNFIDQFGNIDPNQDWNMAQQVTANIDVRKYGMGDFLVTVFPENPVVNGTKTGKAKFLYQGIISGNQKVTFDAPKGKTSLFLRVEQDGRRYANEYISLKNGVMSNTKDVTRAYVAPTGQYAYDGASVVDYDENVGCPTTIDKSRTITMGEYSGGFENVASNGTYPSNRYTEYHIGEYSSVDDYNAKVIDYMKNQGSVYYTNHNGSQDQFDYIVGTTTLKLGSEGHQKEFLAGSSGTVDDPLCIVGQTGAAYYAKDNEGYICYSYYYTPSYSYWNPTKRIPRTETFYHLKDVAINDKSGIKFEDFYPILTTLDEGYGKFGYGYFAEQYDNRTIYPALVPDIEYVLGEDGPISFGMVYGATVNMNKLAYFYWEETPGMTEEQKLAAQMNAPRFILMEDAQPGSNIKCDTEAPGGMTMSNWVDDRTPIYTAGAEPVWLKDGNHTGHDVVGTEYHLAYFGPNYDSQATYNFKEGTHVSFVLINCGNLSTDDWSSAKTYYGMQKHNLATGHRYSESNAAHYSDAHPHSGPDDAIGEIGAVTFSYDGTIIAGFEDGTDMDLNDIMYYVKAPTIKQESKPQEITKIIEDTYDWILACEDLGSTDDYDFNDVVLGIKHHQRNKIMYIEYIDENGNLVTTLPQTIESTNFLEVTPLAAGGVLKSHVIFNDGNSDRDLGEIHSLLDPANKTNYATTVSGDMPMLNTSSFTYKGTPIIIELGSAEFTMENNMGGFSIKVLPKGENDSSTYTSANAVEVKAPTAGDVPQMLLLPQEWKWPKERKNIKDAYPGFKTWTSDSRYTEWMNNKLDELLIAR